MSALRTARSVSACRCTLRLSLNAPNLASRRAFAVQTKREAEDAEQARNPSVVQNITPATVAASAVAQAQEVAQENASLAAKAAAISIAASESLNIVQPETVTNTPTGTFVSTVTPPTGYPDAPVIGIGVAALPPNPHSWPVVNEPVVTSGLALAKAAKQARTPVTLKQLLAIGSRPVEDVLPETAGFLLKELPIRFAHQVHLLERLPRGLCLMPSIRAVRRWYVSSFSDIRRWGPKQPQTPEELAEFARLLRTIRNRHQSTNMAIARGVRELLAELGKDSLDEDAIRISDMSELHTAIDHFHASRIGLLVLMDQQLALAEHNDDSVGIILKETSPEEVVMHAIGDAAYLAEQNFGVAPRVDVRSHNAQSFPYIPSHLYYILFELLKNSMRATCELHGATSDMLPEDLPPIKIVVADGENNEDVVIKVADEGGGIKRSDMRKLWSYFYTTADFVEATSSEDLARDWAIAGAPIAGLGYGLPLSRQYARYFGGDLQILSMEGFGTDAFLHLSKLGTHFERYGIAI